jgi:eukaryotic-like serine/threonine-protein kinase
MNPADSQLAPGTILFGTYEILGVLGCGGMGWVYRAMHRSQNSLRAIKVVRPDLVADPAMRDLFNREAKALLQIQNDAVVRCFDQLQDGSGVYLVMEFVQGISLEDMLKDGPLNAAQVLQLKRRVAEGLAASHAAGVVHRDISPGNIILPDGRVENAKLIDFGVAAVASPGGATIAGDFKGKLAYASPEQFGLFGGKVGPPSDIYSLGLVLAEAAGGRQLHMGQTFYEALEVRKSQPRLPLNIPPELIPELEPLIQPDPAWRPKSGAALLASGRPAVREESRTENTGHTDYQSHAQEQRPRSKAIAWAYSLSAILLGTVLGCMLWIYRSAPPAAATSTANPPAQRVP